MLDDRQSSDGVIHIQRGADSRRTLSPARVRLAPLASSETMSELLNESNTNSSDSSELSEESDDGTSTLSTNNHNRVCI